MNDAHDNAADDRAMLDRLLARSEEAVAEAAEAAARLLEPLPPDYPRDPAPLGPPCPYCGRALVVDVELHPTSSGALLGVARGVLPCACQQ